MIETFKAARLRERTRYGSAPKPATVNRELALFKTVLNRAVNDGLLDRNPCRKVKLLAENNARDRVLTPEEFSRLLETAASYLRPILRLAYSTAACEGEILALTWDKVDLRKGLLTIGPEHSKNRPRTVPLSAEMVDMLAGLPRSLRTRAVFLRHGRPVKSIRGSFTAATARAGLDGLWFHDLRHCAITSMRKAGVPDRVIMKISGHKTLRMLDRYDKIDLADLRGAVNQTATYTATRPESEAERKL